MQRGQLDKDYLRAGARHLQVAELLDRALAEARAGGCDEMRRLDRRDGPLASRSKASSVVPHAARRASGYSMASVFMACLPKWSPLRDIGSVCEYSLHDSHRQNEAERFRKPDEGVSGIEGRCGLVQGVHHDH